MNSTDAIGQSTANLTDAEFAMLKWFVEKRDRDAAHAIVAPVDTAQYRSPGSLTPEIPSDVCVVMEKKNEGRMNPEPTELEPPSAGTGLETPGQQCPSNGETGRTTTGGCLLGGVGSNAGGNAFFSAEIAVGTRPDSKSTTPSAGSNTIFLKASRKPEDKEKCSEENKQFDPGGKGEKPPPWNAAVMVFLSFSGGNAGHGIIVVCASCFFVCVCLSVYCLLFFFFFFFFFF